MFISSHSPALLQDLNHEQLAAVTYPPQSALILAGAGSGKTRVLTTRIAWLLQNNMATVHSIMAVTFTNKAAKEMQTRLSALLPINLRAMWLGTFHGLCHRFLRLHYRDVHLPQSFQILDMQDQLALIKRLLKQLDIGEEILAPRVLQGFINAQKDKGLRSDCLNATDKNTRRMIECYAQYEQQCQQEGVVDFAELMLRSYELLQQNELLRTHYQQRFNHILVDEFQDTSPLQYAWLKLMAGEQAAIFAVGDDDQSIYRFRGADVRNMTTFMREYQLNEPIKLEQNYRSANNILQAANAVIHNNTDRLGKSLRTVAKDGEKIRFFSAVNDIEEARFIIDEVRRGQSQAIPLRQMAVLYRSNAQSRVLEQQFVQAGIPYKIYGGLRFFERQEIKHALAYLRLAVNADDSALLRVINFPPRGIGAKTIEKIQSMAQEMRSSLWDAACVVAKTSQKVQTFVELIKHISLQVTELSLSEVMRNLIDHSGLRTHYAEQKQESERERIANLDELIIAAHDFNPSDNPFENIPDDITTQPDFVVLAFLSYVSLESGENQANDQQDAIQMMTIHAAKGLEFDVVFISGLEEERFPSALSLGEIKGLQEERRLMYVAITRARKRLYLTMAQQRFMYGYVHDCIQSRFINEIPETFVQNLSGSKKSTATKNMTRSVLSDGNKSFDGFCIGDGVRHTKFGEGMIINAIDKNTSCKLWIDFGVEWGIKELDTAFAKDKLEKQ